MCQTVLDGVGCTHGVLVPLVHVTKRLQCKLCKGQQLAVSACRKRCTEAFGSSSLALDKCSGGGKHCQVVTRLQKCNGARHYRHDQVLCLCLWHIRRVQPAIEFTDTAAAARGAGASATHGRIGVHEHTVACQQSSTGSWGSFQVLLYKQYANHKRQQQEWQQWWQQHRQSIQALPQPT